LPVSHAGGPGLNPYQSVWDVFWTEWDWDVFVSKYFGFPLLMSLPRCSIYSFIH